MLVLIFGIESDEKGSVLWIVEDRRTRFNGESGSGFLESHAEETPVGLFKEFDFEKGASEEDCEEEGLFGLESA